MRTQVATHRGLLTKRGLLILGMLFVSVGAVRFRAVEPLPQDSGAAGAWQKIRKLQTTASVLHTTAHPDDEHGGLLALLSRGQGVRTALFTLTRGESGDNAIGSELFDALGLIRTEELAVAGRYYGLDAQYYATVADYGFSKRLDEALDTWNREATLAEVVRVIRIERPLVIVSRFQGTARDGHGQHQAAGVLTQEAFRAAADPKRFPEQLAEGLRPWQALKLYVGGARADEGWTVEVDPGVYDPLLGDSYQTFARRGLSFQRSQNGGRFVAQSGSAPGYYTRLVAADPARPAETTARKGGSGGGAATGGSPLATAAANVAGGRGRRTGPAGSTTGAAASSAAAAAAVAPAMVPATNGGGLLKETGFFEGLDTTLPGIYRTLQLTEPAGANALLVAIEQQVQQAVSSFSVTNPAAAAPALARGLTATRAALAKLGTDPDVANVLRLKERQFMDAITATLGITVDGLALPDGTPVTMNAAASPFAPAQTLAPVVAGQTITVRASFVARGTTPVTLRALDLVTPNGWIVKGGNPGLASRLIENRPVVQRFDVTVAPGAPTTRSHLLRESTEIPRYKTDEVNRHRPSPAPLALVRAEYEIDGTIIEVTEPVQRRESTLPYGYVLRELAVVPAIAVDVTPAQAIVPASGLRKPIPLTVDITNNQTREATGTVALTLPQPDWRADPSSHTFRLGAGQQARVTFSVSTPTVKPITYRVDATVTSDGRTFTEGYQVLAHRDLETRRVYRPAAATVRVMNVGIAPNLRVGYVMGIGDELPAAIAQLGATVELLDAQVLTAAPLERFDAIVLGTRAYAVRPDLHANNARLLDYAKNGGNLIVLYNTTEFDPSTQAPFPAKLTGDAEEVSEEDAAVTILAPQHQVLSRPNRITPADFNGWIEQRGSKFWREWDGAYTPLLECHDQGQPPQRGGWLYARYGKGHYSYVAYAFHRQLPAGVPGAYRLMANLLSLGKS